MSEGSNKAAPGTAGKQVRVPATAPHALDCEAKFDEPSQSAVARWQRKAAQVCTSPWVPRRPPAGCAGHWRRVMWFPLV